MVDEERSVLLIENMDIASPLGCTVAYYVPAELSESHEVHVLCRQRPERREDGSVPGDVVLHDLYTGEVPVLSGLLFVVLSTVYAAILGARYRYDVVYAFQHDVIQGWIGSLAGGSRFVVYLQSVPVRQDEDLTDDASDADIRRRVTSKLHSAYATATGHLLADADAVISLTDGIRGLTETEFDVDLSDSPVIGMGVDVDRFAADGRGGGAADSTPDREAASGETSAETGETTEPSDERSTVVGAAGTVGGAPSADGHSSSGPPTSTEENDDPTGPRADSAAEPLEPVERWTMTYIGSIHRARGLEHVIEVLAETDRDVELRVAGSGSEAYVDSLKRRARDLGVDHRIRWLGLLPHEEMPDLLRSTDVAISPLSGIESYRVSFPAKLLEYLAAGCLVVATDIQPHRRLIEDGENGFLYESGASGFRAALDECLDQRTHHDEIRRAARRTAEAYDWDAIVEQHERVMFEAA